MMSVAPWVNHRIEWLKIREERLEGGCITERKTRNPYGDEKQIKAGEVTAQINLLALLQTCCVIARDHLGLNDAWTSEPPLEHDKSWKEICDTIVSMRNLRNLTFFLWLEFDSCLPEPSNYDMVLRIVSPLKELLERARIYEDGYKNLQVGAVESLQRMRYRPSYYGITVFAVLGKLLDRLECSQIHISEAVFLYSGYLFGDLKLFLGSSIQVNKPVLQGHTRLTAFRMTYLVSEFLERTSNGYCRFASKLAGILPLFRSSSQIATSISPTITNYLGMYYWISEDLRQLSLNNVDMKIDTRTDSVEDTTDQKYPERRGSL
ncbi:hypothetical protein K449DRAFT_431326 [Hypoxylon sp. EC38]|nr:hypothetical protein K449DRAFT_431326 [Hypoxylon sp. EC38]